MNEDTVTALQTIAGHLATIAAALDPAGRYSPATRRALRIAARRPLLDDPQRPGEYGVVMLDHYKVRKAFKKDELMLDLYAMGWRAAGEFPHASLHQRFWDDPHKLPQAWIDAGLEEGASRPARRARCIYRVSDSRTDRGNYRLDVATIELPPEGGDLPALPAATMQGAPAQPAQTQSETGAPAAQAVQTRTASKLPAKPRPAPADGDAPAEDVKYWRSRAQVTFRVKQQVEIAPPELWRRTALAEGAGRIDRDWEDEVIVQALVRCLDGEGEEAAAPDEAAGDTDVNGRSVLDEFFGDTRPFDERIGAAANGSAGNGKPAAQSDPEPPGDESDAPAGDRRAYWLRRGNVMRQVRQQSSMSVPEAAGRAVELEQAGDIDPAWDDTRIADTILGLAPAG
ncbi:MAG: hypothetical protein JXB47_06880 [Anaerolineae bacterium]|nr:hypothetical protein [Anaerolineae bacterium]